MTWPGDPFYFAEKVRLRCLIIAPMLFAECLHPRPVGCTQVFSNDLFGNIATDVLAVVTRFLKLGLTLLRLEKLGQRARLLLWRVFEENKGTFVIARSTDQITEDRDRVVGLLARQPINGHKELLIRVLKVKVRLIHLDLIRHLQQCSS